MSKSSVDTIIIKPSRSWVAVDFRELWRFRELMFALTARDIKVLYKQTFLGAAWAILQPFMTMVVFTIFFGKLAKMPSEGIPYPIFSYSGLLLWQYFSHAITQSGNSLIGSANLIQKIYFPRVLVPMSATFAGIVNYAIASVVLIGMMFFYHYPPSFQLIFVPVIVLVTWMLATGVGLWISALNVTYRDIRYVMPFIVQLWLFVSPVIYPTSMLGKYKWIAFVNPMSGLINAHRAAFLHQQPIDFMTFSLSFGITLVILISGLYYFRKMEKTFADII